MIKKFQISNLKFQISNKILEIGNSRQRRAGFTFIELLTVMCIFAVIGTLSVSILSLTLRSTKKAELVGKVRLSGNLALSQITRSIRYAKSLDTPSVCAPSVTTNSLLATTILNDKMTYSCRDGGISLNDVQLIDTNTVVTTACSFTCSQRTINDPPTILVQFSLLPKNAGFFAETNAPMSFQTSVTMRNYNNK